MSLSLHAVSIAVAIAIAGLRAEGEPEPEPEERPCFSARASPLYRGVGWNHFVDVANDCADTIDCEVATTVDPLPVHVIRVAPGEIVRVVIRNGSVTWVFQPIVTCR